ncbi:MAG: formylglycine-generating enzyme family protein, partial [Pseudomonadota bacterium]
AWLSRTTSQSYRLLSEAEWEYACRAETETAFSFGDTISPLEAKYDYTKYDDEEDTYELKTTEVGRFTANHFGLHDMHGNVWEWCEDVWTDDYQGAPGDGSARTNSDESSTRVYRGGSWDYGPAHLRSANRSFTYPDNRFFDLGFRLARTLRP